MSMSFRIDDEGFHLDVIDYDTETGPFWLVEVDGTPMLAERPLPLEHAIAAFRREVADAEEGDEINLVQCDEETLRWAGVPIRDTESDALEHELDEDEDAPGGEA
jgi:hypothetical protein